TQLRQGDAIMKPAVAMRMCPECHIRSWKEHLGARHSEHCSHFGDMSWPGVLIPAGSIPTGYHNLRASVTVMPAAVTETSHPVTKRVKQGAAVTDPGNSGYTGYKRT